MGGAFTFMHTSNEKQSVFLQNAGLHFCFVMNGYCLAFMKLKAFPHHLGIQLVQDTGCMIGCLPTYSVWAYNDFINYFYKKKSVSLTEELATVQEDMSAEQMVDKVQQIRLAQQEQEEKVFFKDLQSYVLPESKYLSVALLATSWALMTLCKFKKL